MDSQCIALKKLEIARIFSLGNTKLQRFNLSLISISQSLSAQP